MCGSLLIRFSDVVCLHFWKQGKLDGMDKGGTMTKPGWWYEGVGIDVKYANRVSLFRGQNFKFFFNFFARFKFDMN
jgi:hypothetical protein